MTYTVVKVQRPIVSSDEGDPCLVYAKGRVNISEVPYDKLPKWLQSSLEESPKVFCEAQWTRRTWRFRGLAPWQDW
jgi:hypothetical protein